MREKQKQDRINKWLETGKLDISVNTTIRGAIRDFLYEQQNNCCDICHIPSEWKGKPLAFVLDHIDGDASNNKRENLRLVCPNCDS